MKVQFIGHSFLAYPPTQEKIMSMLTTGVECEFYARGGARISQMDEIGPAQGDVCDIAVLHIGGNDVVPRRPGVPLPSPWDVKVRILQYARRVKERTEAKQIWIVPLHPRADWCPCSSAYNRRIRHINRMLEEEVERYAGISFLRVLNFKTNPPSNYDRLGVHPTGPRWVKYCVRVAKAAERYDTA